MNGTLVAMSVPANRLLVDFLRDDLQLKGTKVSCDVQVCGACTVLLDGRPVSACTTLACEAHRRSVQTIEGLAHEGRLHPMQQAFIDHGAFQCGFCTPGMILAATALVNRIPDPGVADITSYMRGNICRCTGYKKIVEAIVAAAQELRENGDPDRLRQGSGESATALAKAEGSPQVP